MVIFALSAVVLFAIAGLAVDAGMSYLTGAAAERAAAAGALEGVTYMPACLTANSICTAPADATDAARAATSRDGFANGATVDGHPVTVTVSQYPAGCVGTACSPNDLTVSVEAWVPSTFMRVLGFGDHEVTSTETAFYLPQLSLGQPGGQLGTDVAGLTSGSGYYFLRTEGWNTNRGEGDAYTPNPSDPNETVLAGTDVHALSAQNGTDYGAISGFSTLPSRGGYNYQITVPAGTATPTLDVYNPAFAPDPCTSAGNTCYHEDDSNDQADYSVMEYTLFTVTDVYNHLSDQPVAQVRVDPINATSCPTVSPTNLNAASTCNSATDARTGASLTPGQFAAVYHSWVNLFSSTQAQATGVVQSGGIYLSSGQLTPGVTYRLRVDTLDANGNIPSGNATGTEGAHKGYALKVLSGGTVCNSCSLGGIDDLAIYTPITLSSGETSAAFNIPVVDISSKYQGLTVDFYVYDVGDLFNGFTANDLSVIDPDNDQVVGTQAGQAPVTICNWGPSLPTSSSASCPYTIPPNDGDPSDQRPITTADGTTGSGGTVETLWCNSLPGGVGAWTGSYGLNGGQDTDDCYNGEWIEFQVTIPSGYQGNSNNCTVPGNEPGAGQPDPICGEYWGLQYAVTGAAGSSSNDTFTLVVSFPGTPTHLIP
jgi:hypothetical protein